MQKLIIYQLRQGLARAETIKGARTHFQVALQAICGWWGERPREPHP